MPRASLEVYHPYKRLTRGKERGKEKTASILRKREKKSGQIGGKVRTGDDNKLKGTLGVRRFGSHISTCRALEEI